MDSFTIKCNISKKAFVLIFLTWGKRKYSIFGLPIIGAYLIFKVGFWGTDFNSHLRSDSLYDLYFGIVLIVLTPLFYVYKGIQEYKKYPFLKEEQTYDFDSEKIRVSFNGMQAIAKWDEITKLVESHKYLLFVSKEGLFYIDDSKLSKEEKEFIYSKVNATKSI